jgi:DUF971 family protein
MHVVDVEVAEDGQALFVVGSDGRRYALDAALLWVECPSARGRVRREQGKHRTPPAGLVIKNVRGIGSYGVNVAFSDGHDRGIYPWSYLAALVERPRIEDFLNE